MNTIITGGLWKIGEEPYKYIKSLFGLNYKYWTKEEHWQEVEEALRNL
jgi:hypothetical protein